MCSNIGWVAKYLQLVYLLDGLTPLSLYSDILFIIFSFSSVAQLCLILCDPMGCSMPGFPVHHQLLALTQIHVH